MTSTLFRFVDQYDSYGLRVKCIEYSVLSETPKGFWFFDKWYAKKRFVLKHSRKRYAHTTKEAALQSYILRRKKQIQILQSQLTQARIGLELAESGQTAELVEVPFPFE